MPFYKDLPLEQLECDPNQPRKNFGTEGDANALLQDMQMSGIDVPLAVLVVAPDRYLILDGHRRYMCAQKLKLPTVPCRVYENLSPAEVERKRYNIQNNRRPWRPLERANAISRIKEAAGLQTPKEVAAFIGMSIFIVTKAIEMRSTKIDYIELMEKYNLSQAYRDEFLKMYKKIHKVKDIEAHQIVDKIFEKIARGKIANSKELRKLKRIFNRDSVNENALHLFLTDPDMTVPTLEQKTVQNGFSWWINQVINKINETLHEGKEFTPQEKPVLLQLRDLLNDLKI
jgi:ParB/RepB/Spo0J family partition protein